MIERLKRALGFYANTGFDEFDHSFFKYWNSKEHFSIKEPETGNTIWIPLERLDECIKDLKGLKQHLKKLKNKQARAMVDLIKKEIKETKE